MLPIAIALLVAHLIAVLSPILFAGYLVIVRGKDVPRRGLFMLAAPAFAYGLVLLAYVSVVVPVRLVLVWLVPTLRHLDRGALLWDLPIYGVADPPAYVLLLTLLGVAYFSVHYLWRRWVKISNALA